MLPDVGGAKSTAALAAAPSPLDLWRLRRLGLECSRALGVWMAEDPESLPQRFLEALPTLLALNARPEVGSMFGVLSGVLFYVSP